MHPTNHLTTLLQTLPDPAWLKDPAGVYLACNPAFEHCFSIRRDDLLGKTDADLFDPDLADFFHQRDLEGIAARRPSSSEGWITRGEGSERRLFQTVEAPVYVSGDTLIGVLGVARDITAIRQAFDAQRSQAQTQLQETVALLQATLDSIPEGITVMSTEREQARAAEAARLAEQGSASIRARILLAEDNLINQEVTVELLREIGLAADLAESGIVAVEMARQSTYDLILMDIQMPGLDGLAAAQLIRQIPGYEQTPILALSAGSFVEDRERCLRAGMNDFVAKPIDPEALFAALARWLAPSGATPATLDGPHDPVSPHQALTTIPGLVTATGLRSMHGRLERYLRLLRTYATTYSGSSQLLREHLAYGRLIEAAGVVHSLKGAAATLGAVRVQTLAADLEVLIRRGHGSDELLLLTASLDAEQASLAEAIMQALPLG
ncbi:MAG: response regulator [Chloroflexales bacterium]|nr:response regulator [Chloroflexales bacterium]